jgi:DNA-binding NarL/FixJ family response regulator
MQIHCIVRVLVVDNDLVTRSQLLRILRGAKYLVCVAEGQGAELGISAKRLALEFKPHVVIMDLRLADEHADDRSGLELWKDESFSSARCILYSAYFVQNYRITREAWMQGVSDVVGKEDSPQVLIDTIERIARQACGCRKGLTIAWPAAWNEDAVVNFLFNEKEDIPRDMVIDVLGRLFPDAKSITLKTLDGSSQSSVIGGHGRTLLFQAWPDDREPVVVKLAPCKRIDREVKAYTEFIAERLGGRFYADLQKSNIFWDLGGICYSFMGSSRKSLKTFTAFYRDAGDAKSVLKPLKHFFEEVWVRRYEDSHPLQVENLFDAYDPSQKLHKRLVTFPIQEKTITFPGIPGEFVNPIIWIARHKADSHFHRAKQTTIHGDLHGDNIFVDDDHAWAIDFERSGTGHILRDFVELEQNIVTELIEIPDDNLHLFYYIAMILTKPVSPSEPIVVPKFLQENEEVKKGLEAINGLREIAQKVTGFECMPEYYWGLLLDTCFRLVLSDMHSSRWWRCLLFASILCTRLKEWGKKWPPLNWLPIENKQGDYIVRESSDSRNKVSGQGSEGNVTNLYVNGNFDGNLIIGDGNQTIKDSYNKVAAAKIDPELQETLHQLVTAVAAMAKELPKEQAAEVSEDLGKLVEEATKPKPNKKWYSVSIDGLIKAAENLDKLGLPVISLSKKILSQLTAGASN